MLELTKIPDEVKRVNLNPLPTVANAVVGVSVFCAAELLFQSYPEIVDPWVGRTVVVASLGACFAFFRAASKVTAIPVEESSQNKASLTTNIIPPPIPSYPPPPSYPVPSIPVECDYPTVPPPSIPAQYLPLQKAKALQKMLEAVVDIDFQGIDISSIPLEHHSHILQWLENITNNNSSNSMISRFEPWNEERQDVAKYALALLKHAVENDRFLHECFIPLVKESNEYSISSRHVLYCFNKMVRGMDSYNFEEAPSLSELNLQLYGKFIRKAAEKNISEQDKNLEYLAKLDIKAFEHAFCQKLGINTALTPYCVKEIAQKQVEEVIQQSRDSFSRMFNHLPEDLRILCNHLNCKFEEIISDSDKCLIHKMMIVMNEKQCELDALENDLQKKLESPDLQEMSKQDLADFESKLLSAFTQEKRRIIDIYVKEIRKILQV